MSDWNIGDLAVCVEPGDWFDINKRVFDSFGPEVGSVCTVEGFGECSGEMSLLLFEWPADEFTASAFRKIRPDAAEGHASDWELILEGSKRKVSA